MIDFFEQSVYCLENYTFLMAIILMIVRCSYFYLLQTFLLLVFLSLKDSKYKRWKEYF